MESHTSLGDSCHVNDTDNQAATDDEFAVDCPSIDQHHPASLPSFTDNLGQTSTSEKLSGLLSNCTSLTTVAMATIASTAGAFAEDLWKPTVGASAVVGENDALGSLELFFPMMQDEDSVFYLDLRLDPENIDQGKGSYGLGVRQIVDGDLMVGGYVFYNNERVDGNDFKGLSIGAEAITAKWDASVNAHIPISGDVSIGATSSGGTVSLVGNQLLAQSNSKARRVLMGADVELGRRIRNAFGEGKSLRFSAAGYRYQNTEGADFDITGGRVGFDFEFKDPNDAYSPSLTFGGSVSHDNFYKTQFTGHVRLTIPLGGDDAKTSTYGLELDGSENSVSRSLVISEGLLDRVNTPIRSRGLGIMSAETGTTTSSAVINPATGQPFGAFTFADDANSAGAGTFADPTTLNAAITNAGADGFVVALENGLAANINSAGETLQDGQTLIGGGSTINIQVDGALTRFTLPGAAGTIEGTGANSAINLANANIIRDLTLAGGGGIAGNGITDGSFNNVAISATGGPGVSIVNGAGTFAFNNVDISNSGGIGVDITGGAANFVFDAASSITHNSSAHAIRISAQTGGGAVFNGDVTATASAGIEINGSAGDVNFTGNVGLTNSTGDAIDVTNTSGNVTFATVDIDGGVQGIDLNNNTGTFTLNGGTIDGTTSDAVNATNSAANVSGVTIGANSAIGGDGIDVSNTDGTSRTSILNGNTIGSATTDIAGRGVVIGSTGTGTATVNFVGNHSIRSTNAALEATATNTNTLVMALDNITAERGTVGLTFDIQGASHAALTTPIVVTSLNSFTLVANGTNGGALFNNVAFDADGLSGGAVAQVTATGSTNLGQGLGATQRVQGDGLSFLSPVGDINFTSLNIFNNGGTGLEVDTKTAVPATTFNLDVSAGGVNTTGGAALFLDPLTGDLTFDSITGSGSVTAGATSSSASGNGNAITIDGFIGSLTSGSTTITGLAAGETGVSFTNNTAGTSVDLGTASISSAADNVTGIDLQNTNGETITTGAGSSVNLTGTGTVGVDLSAAGTNANFTFGDGTAPPSSTITAEAAFDIAGFGGTGIYNFLDVDFTNVNLGPGFNQNTSHFFSQNGAGLMDGSSAANASNTTVADANNAADTTFVSVGGGTIDLNINGDGTLNLAANQDLVTYATVGGTVNIGATNPFATNILLNLTAGIIDDGNATGRTSLTTSGNAVVVSLGENSQLTNVDINNNGANAQTAIAGTGALGTSVLTNVDIAGTVDGIALNNVSGTLMIDGTSSISGTTGTSYTETNSTANVTVGATLNQSNAASAIVVDQKSAGTTTFEAMVTADTSTATAVNLTNITGSTINFHGGLDIDTTTGTGFFAMDPGFIITGSSIIFPTGGTVNISATAGDESINATNGKALKLDNVVANITFDAINASSTGSQVAVDIDDVDGSLTINSGTFSSVVGGTNNTIDVEQSSFGGSKALALTLTDLNITHDASASNGGDDYGLHVLATGGDSAVVSISNSTFKTEDEGILFVGANSHLTVTEFSNITLLGDSTASIPNFFGNGVTFSGVTFDSDLGTAGLQAVDVGNLSFGTSTAKSYLGLQIIGAANQGTLSIANYQAHTYSTGLEVSGDQSAFTLNIPNADITASNVVIRSTGGPTTANITLSSLTLDSTNSTASAFELDNVAGSFAVTGATAIIDPELTSDLGGFKIRDDSNAVSVSNSSVDVQFNTLDIQSTNVAPTFPSNELTTGGATVGINLSGNSGTFTVSGTTSIADTVEDGIRISDNTGAISFGTTNIDNAHAVLLSGIVPINVRETSSAAIDIEGTNTSVTFGATTITNVTNGNTGIDFTGADTPAAFGVTTISGPVNSAGTGIDLSSTQNNQPITFATGSSITFTGTGASTGVQLASGDTNATSANANFTFGDGSGVDANGTNSTISVGASGFTVDTIGLNATSGTYNFQDVNFTGDADLVTAGTAIFVSQSGGALSAGTFGLSNTINTISVATAEAQADTNQTFTFVGNNLDFIALGASGFVLDDGQSVDGFANGNTVSSGSVVPVNVSGIAGGLGNITANDTQITNTFAGVGDVFNITGSSIVQNVVIDGAGATQGSLFHIIGSGAAVVQNITVQNDTSGRIFNVANHSGTVTIANNSINTTSRLLHATGVGDVTLTRGTGTEQTAQDIVINKTGGAVNFNGNLTLNGGTVTAVDVVNNANTTINFNGQLDINNTSGTGAQVIGSSGTTSVNFLGGLDITTTTGMGFNAGAGGTITVANAGVEQVTATGTGGAININGVTVGAGGINFDSVTSSATATVDGVQIIDATGGTITFTTVNLASVVGTAGFNISGDARTSNVVVSGGTINSGARVNGNGTGTVQIDANVTDNAGYAFQVANRGTGAGAITVNGTVTNSTGAVSLQSNTAGDVTFNGIVTGTGANTAGAIDIDNVSGGTNTFAALVDIDVTGNGTGVLIGNTNAGGTIDFTGGLDISSVNGVGFEALSGTVSVANAGVEQVIATGTAGAINLDSMIVGAGGINFDQVTTAATSTSNSIDIDTTTGGTVNIASANLNGTNASLGLLVTDANTTVNVVAGTINNGVLIVRGANPITIGANITKATGAALNIIRRNTNTAITINGNITSAATAVNVFQSGGALLNVNGTVAGTGTDATGSIDLSENGGGSVITFANQVTLNMTGSGAGVHQDTTNGGADVRFTGGLDITTVDGTGLGFQSGRLLIANAATESITTTGTAGALILDSVIVTSGGINFDSVTSAATATTDGVQINDTTGATVTFTTVNLAGVVGTAGLDISGDARTSNVVVSGGTITSGARVSNDGTGTVQIDANITENAGYAFQVANRGAGAGAITVNGTVTNSTGAVSLQSNSDGDVTFNGIVTGTGANNAGAIDIDNVSGGTVTFAALVDIDVTGNGTGIEIGNSSATINFNAATDITVANAAAVELTGTIGGTLTFADLDIGLTGDNSTGFDASGAIINANISATDFDLTSTSTTGTTGVDLAGTTGTGAIVLGELNTNGGADATINGVNSGVSFSATTNTTFTFGDGDGTTGDLIVSSISAVTPITGTLPTSGAYDFEDVTFTGDVSNLSGGSVTFFVFDEEGTSGAGTFADPGTAGEAEVASVDVLVAVDNSGVVGNTIDLSSVEQGSINTLTLDDNQALIGLINGQTIDASTLGVSLSAGPSANFLFTGLAGGTTNITGSGVAAGVLATVATTGANNTISLAGTGTIQSIFIDNVGTGDAVNASFATAETATIRSATIIASGGDAIDISTTAGASTVILEAAEINGGLRLNGAGGSTLAANTVGAANTISAAAGAAVAIDGVTTNLTFASIAGNGGGTTIFGVLLRDLGANSNFAVSGTTTLDNYTGDSIRLTTISNNDVAISFGTTNINTTVGQVFLNGTGVTVSTISGSNFDADFGALTVGNATDNSAGGLGILNVTGAGADIDVASFTSNRANRAFQATDFDTVGASVTVAGTTNITNARQAGVFIAASAGNVTFAGNTTITNNSGFDGDGVEMTTNTGTYSFAGLDVSVTGAGAFGLQATNSGTLNITGGTNNITSNNGTAVLINPTVVNATFQSLTSSNAAGNGVDLTLAGGSTFTVTGSTNVNSSVGNGVNIVGQTGTSTVSLGTLNINNSGGPAGAGLSVLNLTSGTLSLNTTAGSINTGNDRAIGIGQSGAGSINLGMTLASSSASVTSGTDANYLQNTSGSLTINGGTVTLTGSGQAFDITGGSVSISSAQSVNSTAATSNSISVSSVTGGTNTFSGAFTDTGGTNGGSFNFTNNSGGATNLTGNVTINSATVTALSVTNSANHAVTFSGANTDIDTTTGKGVTISNGGTIAFNSTASTTITSDTGTAFEATGGGVVTVTSNAVAGQAQIDVGSAFFGTRISGVGIGAGGVTLGSVIADGSTIGLDFGNLTGPGAINIGTANLQNITTRGINISGTHTAAINFTDLDISVTGGSAVAFDMDGATINADITVTDFDVTNTAAAGSTVGIDLAGTTGSGNIQLGDGNTNGGSTQNIGALANPFNTGVRFSATTSRAGTFTFGDGNGAAGDLTASNIHATTAIETATSTGTFDFEDVDTSTSGFNSVGGPSIFVFDELASTGAGTFTDPGTVVEAEASSATVLVAVNDLTAGDNINLNTLGVSGGTLNLDSGQVLISLAAGASYDVANLGVSSGSLPTGLLFTGLTAGTTITATGGTISGTAPTITDNGTTHLIELASTGNSGVGNSTLSSGGTTSSVIDLSTPSGTQTIFIDTNVLLNGRDSIEVTPDAADMTTVNITGNTFTSPNTHAIEIATAMGFAGLTTFTITGNTINDAGINQTIRIDLAQSSAAGTRMSGTIGTNTIGTALTANSGGAVGIEIEAEGAGTIDVDITNNVIREWRTGQNGLAILTRNSARVDATITNNTFEFSTGGLPSGSMLIDVSSVPADTSSICAIIQGNDFVTVTAPDFANVLIADFGGNGNIRLPGYTGGATDAAAVTTFIQGNNIGTPSHNVVPGSATFTGFGTTCP